MTKLEIARMRFNFRVEELAKEKKELTYLKEQVNNALDKGYYNQAAQWAEKISRVAYQVEAMQRDCEVFNAILNTLEEE